MTSEETDKLERITISLEKIASTVSKSGVLNMRDTDRAKIYREHLGKKLNNNA